MAEHTNLTESQTTILCTWKNTLTLPPNIINEVPKAISKRLTSISGSKNVFERNIEIYKTTLKKSGFDQTLIYDEEDEPTVIALTKKVTKRGNASEISYGTTHHILWVWRQM